jgi:hypothetical protein
MRTLRFAALLVATGAFLVAPVAVQAKHNHPDRHANNHARGCNHTPHVGFVISGTLTSFTADDPNTPANEASVTLTVKHANRHARHSGELPDQDANKRGVQVAGDTYTVNGATDSFRLRLVDYEAGETPAAGDTVRVSGLIPRTKKRCAAEGTSTADRYGTPNVRRVTIKDADGD